jgi:hypothetical protein
MTPPRPGCTRTGSIRRHAITETPPPASSNTPALVLTNADKQAVTEFEARVAEYAALHQKLEASLPALPDKATP